MISREEMRLVKQIADRAASLYNEQLDTEVNPVFIEAEIQYCHVHVCPLRLKEFAEADDSNFAHDISGIHRHLNYRRNIMDDCFMPRFARL